MQARSRGRSVTRAARTSMVSGEVRSGPSVTSGRTIRCPDAQPAPTPAVAVQEDRQDGPPYVRLGGGDLPDRTALAERAHQGFLDQIVGIPGVPGEQGGVAGERGAALAD